MKRHSECITLSSEEYENDFFTRPQPKIVRDAALHNENGPAVKYPDGSFGFYLNGLVYTEADWKEAIATDSWKYKYPGGGVIAWRSSRGNGVLHRINGPSIPEDHHYCYALDGKSMSAKEFNAWKFCGKYYASPVGNFNSAGIYINRPDFHWYQNDIEDILKKNSSTGIKSLEPTIDQILNIFPQLNNSYGAQLLRMVFEKFTLEEIDAKLRENNFFEMLKENFLYDLTLDSKYHRFLCQNNLICIDFSANEHFMIDKVRADLGKESKVYPILESSGHISWHDSSGALHNPDRPATSTGHKYYFHGEPITPREYRLWRHFLGWARMASGKSYDRNCDEIFGRPTEIAITVEDLTRITKENSSVLSESLPANLMDLVFNIQQNALSKAEIKEKTIAAHQ